MERLIQMPAAVLKCCFTDVHVKLLQVLFSLFSPFPLEIPKHACVHFHVCKRRAVGFCRPRSSSDRGVVFVTAQRLSRRASPERPAAHGAVRQAEANTMAPTVLCAAVMGTLFQPFKQRKTSAKR